MADQTLLHSSYPVSRNYLKMLTKKSKYSLVDVGVLVSNLFFREFYKLTTTAFLALRKHCAYVVYAVTSLCKQLKISDDACKEHLAVLKDNLMLNLTDAAATTKLNDLYVRGLKADYQLNVSFG